MTNRLGFINVRRQKEVANRLLLEQIGFRGAGIDDSTVGDLSGGERQGIAIGRAMYFDADLIILDEPTVALALKEVQKVLDFVRGIKESGRACIYIEHNLAHVHELADRLVILDRGEVVSVIGRGELSLAELTRYLIDLQSAREGARRHDPPPARADRGSADHRRAAGAGRGVHDRSAPGVSRLPHLHVVPGHRAAAADPGARLTLVIASGEIDLSFPSVIAFSGFLFAWAFKTYELTWLALLLALAGGALVGWVNGILVAVIGIPSIIATLATQFWGGITTVMTGGLSYAIRTIDDYAIHTVLVGRIGVVPVQALWATAVAVALWFVLNRHRFGEHLLFIGDNVEVARVVGVNVGREKIKLFTLMGVLGAFAAVL